MPRSRALSRALVVGGASISVVLLGACSSGSSPYPAQSAIDPSETSLAIVVNADGKVHEWTLTCDPDGGTHPDPQGGCAFLDLAKQWGQDPFAPTPADRVCTKADGGQQTATVKGVWNGKPVDARFDQANSCEIERWSNNIRLLVVAGAA